MPFRCLWLGLLLLLGPRRASHAQTPTDTVARQLDAHLRQLLVSPLVRVAQARAEMVHDLRRDQVARLPGLLDYLLHRIAPADSLGRLSPNERALVLAAAGQFRPLLAQVAVAPPYWGRNCRAGGSLPADGLEAAAQGYVARHADSLALAARRAPLPPVEATFLALYLPVLAQPNAPVSDSLNAGLRRFVRQYPASPLADVAKEYVRYEIVPSPFTVGGEFFLGGTFFQGGLGSAFTNTVRLGMGGEASWRRYLLYGRFAIGNLRPRATYTFGKAVWEPDQSLNYSQAEISAGYCVLDSRRLRLTPFAGAGLLWLSPVKQNNQPLKPEADYRLWFNKPFTAGLNLEIKLDNVHERRFGPGPLTDSDWSLRLRSGWRQAEALQGPPTAGGVYYVEVGLGGFVRMAGTRR